jgi:hypothetical protein
MQTSEVPLPRENDEPCLNVSRSAKTSQKYDPGKWEPVFGKDHAQISAFDPSQCVN